MLHKIARVFLVAFLSLALSVGSISTNSFGLGETMVLVPTIAEASSDTLDYAGHQLLLEPQIVLHVQHSVPPALVAEYTYLADLPQIEPESVMVSRVPRVHQGSPLWSPLVTLHDRDMEGFYGIAIAFALVAHQNFVPDRAEKLQVLASTQDIVYPPWEARVRKQVEPTAGVRKRHPSYYSHKA